MIVDLRMAWRSLRQSPGLSVVMIAALSLGIATWYVQHQVFVFLRAKLPDAPAGLYQIELAPVDSAEPQRPQLVGGQLGSILLTRRDAEGVLRGAHHDRTLTFAGPILVEASNRPPLTARARYATRDLFALFDIPVEGRRWAESANEAVVSQRFAARLELTIGQSLEVGGTPVRIVGIVPASYDDRYHLYERLTLGADDLYLPLSLARDPELQHRVAGTEPGLAVVWAALPSEDDRRSVIDAADRYFARAGRAGHEPSIRLRSAAEWRETFEPGGTINLWPLLALMCVAASIVNLVRMLMAKFAGRGHDLGLLRAFGARRRAVMAQLLVEAGLIGLVAAAVGLGLGIAMMPLALRTLETMTADTPPVIDAPAVLITLGVSIGASLVAALYPAWRLSRGTVAMQLSSR